MADLVIDASALIDLVMGNSVGSKVLERISNSDLHAPAHIDAEVFSALGRLFRAGDITVEMTEEKIRSFLRAPIQRHQINDLMLGAWERRNNLSLKDALYAELSHSLSAPLITTDKGLSKFANAEFMTLS
jgi:predicted nucleic acid-binding protein